MSFYELIKAEFKAIFTNPAIVLTVLGGAILYSFLYPQPYLNQLPRKQKVILIDLDNSRLSRKIARMVNSSPQINLTEQSYDIEKAKSSIQKGEIAGYLLIPKNFYKDVELKKSPTLVYGGNASYFLVYGSIAESIFEVAKEVNEEILLSRKLHSAKNANPKENQPLKLNARPAFNTTLGYINYVIPAVFILIFHQIMLIGASIQGATQTELRVGYWQLVSPLKLMLARFFVYLIVYLPIGFYYMGFCFERYGVPHVASTDVIILFMLTIIVSATSMGMALGELIPRRELATFVVLVSSLPLVFTAGFVWPTYAITPWLSFLVQWVPATPAILSMVELNQMGADFTQVYDKWLQICMLGFFYMILALLLMRRKRNQESITP